EPAKPSAVESAPVRPEPVRDKSVPLPVKPLAPMTAPKPISVPTPRSPQAPPQEDEPARIPWVFWPLLLVNWLFDLALLPSGALGRTLRTRGGRSFLGMVGLGCLAAACAWALLDYLGLDLPPRLR